MASVDLHLHTVDISQLHKSLGATKEDMEYQKWTTIVSIGIPALGIEIMMIITITEQGETGYYTREEQDYSDYLPYYSYQMVIMKNVAVRIRDMVIIAQ